MTRPDIASAVREMARHAHNPAARHWKAIRKIITYLKVTKDLWVVFRRRGDLKLSLFADADNADKFNDRRSVSGVAVMLGNTALRASSTTQYCRTLSTSEAEYMTMAHGARTASAIKTVLNFVQPHLSGRTIDMYEDDEGAKALAKNPQGSHHSNFSLKFRAMLSTCTSFFPSTCPFNLLCFASIDGGGQVFLISILFTQITHLRASPPAHTTTASSFRC